MSEVEVNKISTEAINTKTKDIDLLSTEEILTKINQEDQTVAYAVQKAIPQIKALVDITTEKLENGGRLIYIGAGTSGRLGILDAAECPPTYGVSKDLVIGLMAGGLDATKFAAEGAEDKKELGESDLKKINLNKNDIVVALAASGRTPYVIGGVEYAKKIGATTACITTSCATPLAKIVDYPVEAVTGPEVINGSTRMKSGTAQKLICNMLTTTCFIKIGKVYGNMMIDVEATNEKLVARQINIIKEITGYDTKEAQDKLNKYQTIKKVLLNYFTKVEDITYMEMVLEKTKGNIRKAIKEMEIEKNGKF